MSTCPTPIATATLYETRTTVLPTRIVTVDDVASVTRTLTSSYTSTIQLPTDTLFSTPPCPTNPQTLSSSSSSQGAPAGRSSATSAASSTTQTLTSALATVSDARGQASVVYVTYTQTRSSIPPVVVTVEAAAPSATSTDTQGSTSSPSGSSGHTNGGVIAGAVIGAVAALLILASLVAFTLRRRRRRGRSNEALDDLFQRSGGGAAYLPGPSRGNSHHSTIRKNSSGGGGDDNNNNGYSYGNNDIDIDVAAHVPTLPEMSMSMAMSQPTHPRASLSAAALAPPYPLHVNTAPLDSSEVTASASSPAASPPPPAPAPPRLDRSASANSALHRLSNPTLLAAMDVRSLSPGHTPPKDSDYSPPHTITPGEDNTTTTTTTPPPLLGARPPSSLAGANPRSTPSSPTIYPSSHVASWYGGMPAGAQGTQGTQHPAAAAHPHPSYFHARPRYSHGPRSPPPALPHNRHSLAGFPSPPSSPTYAPAQPQRAVSPPPSVATAAPPRRAIQRNRTLSAGSLSQIVAQNREPERPLSPTSFGVQPLSPASPPPARVPHRRSTASPPPSSSSRGDWPPSRYGHLDIATRRLSVAREDDGGGVAAAPAPAATATAATSATAAPPPQPSFWRSSVHGTDEAANVAASSREDRDASAAAEAEAAAERRLWGNHNLFVANADDGDDD